MCDIDAERTRRWELEEISGRLHMEMQQRSQREGLAYDDLEDYETLAWVLFEREAMTEEVNRLRAKYNLPQVSTATVWRKCESQAVGHVDYSKKFALYCLQLGRGEID